LDDKSLLKRHPGWKNEFVGQDEPFCDEEFHDRRGGATPRELELEREVKAKSAKNSAQPNHENRGCDHDMAARDHEFPLADHD
jgi:hypothetical protein